MNPQLSVFVWREEISTGIQPIWDLYSIVFENNYTSEEVAKCQALIDFYTEMEE
jgi:hypothetical protein